MNGGSKINEVNRLVNSQCIQVSSQLKTQGDQNKVCHHQDFSHKETCPNESRTSGQTLSFVEINEGHDHQQNLTIQSQAMEI